MTKLKNKFEQKINRQLKRSHLEYRYETEKIPYILARHYVPDFVVQTPQGKLYIECKGYLRPEDKAKLVAVRKFHPEKDLRIIFYSHNRRYIKWAEKVGIPWAIGKIPREWIY